MGAFLAMLGLSGLVLWFGSSVDLRCSCALINHGVGWCNYWILNHCLGCLWQFYCCLRHDTDLLWVCQHRNVWNARVVLLTSILGLVTMGLRRTVHFFWAEVLVDFLEVLHGLAVSVHTELLLMLSQCLRRVLRAIRSPNSSTRPTMTETIVKFSSLTSLFCSAVDHVSTMLLLRRQMRWLQQKWHLGRTRYTLLLNFARYGRHEWFLSLAYYSGSGLQPRLLSLVFHLCLIKINNSGKMAKLLKKLVVHWFWSNKDNQKEAFAIGLWIMWSKVD